MATATATRTPSLSPLLAGYISGDVSEAAMALFDELFAETSASAGERAAFARFYLDALESGEFAEALPHPAEVSGILSVARA